MSLMFGHDAYGSSSSSRQGISYGAGSCRRSDGVNIYSSSYGGHYLSRGGDVCIKIHLFSLFLDLWSICIPI
ncbi:hypothetical protein Hanom_Chr13g01214861 [Helianthus anomalus]